MPEAVRLDVALSVQGVLQVAYAIEIGEQSMGDCKSWGKKNYHHGSVRTADGVHASVLDNSLAPYTS